MILAIYSGSSRDEGEEIVDSSVTKVFKKYFTFL